MIKKVRYWKENLFTDDKKKHTSTFHNMYRKYVFNIIYIQWIIVSYISYYILSSNIAPLAKMGLFVTWQIVQKIIVLMRLIGKLGLKKKKSIITESPLRYL